MEALETSHRSKVAIFETAEAYPTLTQNSTPRHTTHSDPGWWPNLPSYQVQTEPPCQVQAQPRLHTQRPGNPMACVHWCTACRQVAIALVTEGLNVRQRSSVTRAMATK